MENNNAEFMSRWDSRSIKRKQVMSVINGHSSGKCDKRCINGLGTFQYYDVPQTFREPYILSGYRKPYITAWQCLQSVFEVSNETVNIWSHSLSFAYLFWRFMSIVTVSSSWYAEPMFYPLLSSGLGSLVMYFTSSAAHTFNSISARFYITCFLFDYAAISFYAFTSGISFFFYFRSSQIQWHFFESPACYLGSTASLSLFGTYFFCKTRQNESPVSVRLRVVPPLVTWFFATLPYTASATLSWDTTDDKLIKYFTYHALYLFLGGFFYASRIPEKFSPGSFDLIFNSHNLMHICSLLSTDYAASMLELVLLQRNKLTERELEATFLNTVGITVLVLMGNILIVLCFFLRSGERKDKNK